MTNSLEATSYIHAFAMDWRESEISTADVNSNCGM